MGDVIGTEAGTVDAVVVVPGIMGSTLTVVDEARPRQVWSVGAAVLDSARIGAGRRLRALAIQEGELSGKVRRVVPTGLLAAPDWLPGIGGMEPYGRLVKKLRTTVLHPDAVLPFAYDWRLDVVHNGRELARAAGAHLARWRDHGALRELRGRRADDREPRLVIVAHSMGGLLVQAMSLLNDEPLDVRAVVTLGTPFVGSVKTTQLIATGAGAPLGLPKAGTRQACRTMPGLYDLLPWYRCRIQDGVAVALREEDVTALGGDRALVEQAFRRRHQLDGAALPGEHQAIVGIGQATAQSVELNGGAVVLNNWSYRRNSAGVVIEEAGRPVRENLDGDGTVFRYAARTRVTSGVAVAAHHQALAANDSALRMVTKVLTEATDLDTVLGDEDEPLGLSVPDEAAPGADLEMVISSSVSPARISCTIEDTASGDRVVRSPRITGRPSQGDFPVRSALDAPGLYRVRVSAGPSTVTKLVMVGDAADDDVD